MRQNQFYFFKNAKYLFTVIIFWLQTIAFAQIKPENDCNCQLHGEVNDVATKQPILGAVILLKGTTKGTTTDSKGHYHFNKLCHGSQIIICRIVGYQEISLKINLNHNENYKHDFKLNEDEYHLDHVEIKASKIENLTQAKNSLENSALDQTRGQTLGEALKQISGITTLQTGSSISKPVIHGMHSNRILILNNGIRQEGQQWGSEHAPEIDPFVANKITVLKGAAGVRYGSDAIAGVVKLEPEALPDTNKIGGEFNSVFFSNGRQTVNSGILEAGLQPKKRINAKLYSFGFRLQGTIKRGGNISTPSYTLANTGVEEKNFSIAANYKSRNWLSEVFFSHFNTKIGIFSGSHIGNITDLIAALQREKPQAIYSPKAFNYAIDRPFQDVEHSLLKVLNSKSMPIGKLSFTFGYQNDFRREVDILRGDKNLVQLFKLDTYTGEIIFEHKPVYKLFTGSIGMAAMVQENLTTGVLKAPRSSTVLIPNFNNNTMGVFLIERIVRNKWELETGIRYDTRKLKVYRIPRGQQDIVSNNKDNQNVTATFGYNFRPDARWNLLTNFSSAWRAATVNELYSNGVHHGAGSFERGNENLLPEVALNASFTINYAVKKLQVELHLYNNNINNYIFLSPTGRPILSVRGAFPEFFYTQTKARFQGIDFSMNYQIGKNLSLNSKMALLKAHDISNKQPLIMIPANRWENGIRYENKNSFISFNYQFVAKQSRVPLKIIFSEIPSSEIIFNEFGGDYAPPPPAYHLFGASFGHNFTIRKKQQFSLSLTGSNLANTRYRDYLNRFRYFSDEIGRNFVLRGKFNF